MSSPELATRTLNANVTVHQKTETGPQWGQAMAVVENLIMAALLECCPVHQYRVLRCSGILDDLKPLCAEDLLAFARKDPASGNDIEIIARTSTSYAAVLHYRVANWIHACFDAPEKVMLAALITRRGKLLSGAEIHFKSRFGRRFVLDHGYGTVIGETSVIGDDCYILGGVTLGSRLIAANTHGPRHPCLGDRVQVGMNSSLLGHIHVADDAFIGSCCLVTQDVPAGQNLSLSKGQDGSYLE